MPIGCDSCAATDLRFGGLDHCCSLARVEAKEGEWEANEFGTGPTAQIEAVTDPREEALPC